MSVYTLANALALQLEDRSSGNGLADIIHRYLDGYRSRHKLSPHQYRALAAIRSCRTRDMGAHLRECLQCNFRQIAYNSCGNRHCPKCQTNRSFKWMKQQLDQMLPIPYYHVVFTLPHQLNNLALCNKAAIYQLFFDSAAQTLQAFAADPKYLGAKLGIIAILHTWGQNLSYHVHLHMIVTAGGLCEDSCQWKPLPYRSKFIFPVKAVSKVMRGKFLQGLRSLYEKDQLSLPGGLQPLAWSGNFKHFINQLYKTHFYSYAKKPLTGCQQIFQYLARYTHKVAISNSRIKRIDDGEIRFSYKDYRDDNRIKVMRLSALEFLRRFLQHILPPGFRKIRYYGIFAPACRTKSIALIRQLLALKVELSENNPHKDEILCPACQRGWLTVTRYISAPQLAVILSQLKNQLSFNFDSS